MKQRFPKHLSYRYKLNLENLPVRAKDRLSCKVLIAGIVIGFLMAMLGILEMTDKFRVEKDFIYPINLKSAHLHFNHLFVDYSYIIIGIGIILWTIIAYIRYKKIYFNGRTFDVDFKGVFGETELFDEHLRNYRGVRMRVEFCQWGILTKNKYIIELEHIDPGKTIPLYISTDSTEVYDIWHYYAKRLDMPTIIDTDEGVKVVDTRDLNKSLKDYIISLGLAPNYAILPPKPRVIKYSQRRDKIVLSVKKSFWDVYNMIAFIWLAVYGAVYYLAVRNYEQVSAMINSPWKTHLLFAVATILLIIWILWLFKREKIVIKSGRIILIYNFFFISRKRDDVAIEELKDIEILRSPNNNRHYLALISQYNVAVLGSKMPLELLRWLKKFIISEIIK